MSSTKKRTRAQAKRAWINACTKWRDILWLGDYTVRYDGVDNETGADGWHTLASVKVKPHYREAAMEVDYEQLRGLSDEDIEEQARHEMVHVATGEMLHCAFDMLQDLPKAKVAEHDRAWHTAMETVTTRLEIILRRHKDA